MFIGQPKIVKSLKDTEINEGETLVLEIEVYAKPEPKIVWLVFYLFRTNSY